VALQFRRGTAADVASESFVPLIGEPLYLTDEERLYIGDGSTQGGNAIGGATDIDQLQSVNLISEAVGTITSYSVTGNTALIVLSQGQDYYVGLSVVISDSSVSALNGTHVINSIPANGQFTFAFTSADVAVTNITGTVTPEIPDNNVLAWDAASNTWVDRSFEDTNVTLGELSDVTEGYGSVTVPHDNTNVGNCLRYNYGLVWASQRPGQVIDNASDQGYIGADFTVDAATVYTANSSLWSAQSGGNNATLHSASPGAVPAPPYGDAVFDDASTNFVGAGSFSASTDFTYDFWLYRPAGQVWDQGIRLSNGSDDIQSYVRYINATLQLRTELSNDGDYSFHRTVREWTVPDLDDEWVHVAIVRQGSSFRAWVNGTDELDGTEQNGTTDDFNFRFQDTTRIHPQWFDDVGNLLGPFFVDLQKCHYDPTGGDINVPVERQNFYALKAGVNVTELDDVYDLVAPVHGDTLVYYENYRKWLPGKPLFAKYQLELNAAPTAEVPFSDRIGSLPAISSWVEFRHGNNAGPLTAEENPTLRIGEFQGFFDDIPPGIYRFDVVAEITMNNLAADSYTSHSVNIDPATDSAAAPELSSGFTFTTNSNAISAPVTQTISFSHTVVFTGTDIANNHFSLELDSNQSDEFYCSNATLVLTKIG